MNFVFVAIIAFSLLLGSTSQASKVDLVSTGEIYWCGDSYPALFRDTWDAMNLEEYKGHFSFDLKNPGTPLELASHALARYESLSTIIADQHIEMLEKIYNERVVFVSEGFSKGLSIQTRTSSTRPPICITKGISYYDDVDEKLYIVKKYYDALETDFDRASLFVHEVLYKNARKVARDHGSFNFSDSGYKKIRERTMCLMSTSVSTKYCWDPTPAADKIKTTNGIIYICQKKLPSFKTFLVSNDIIKYASTLDPGEFIPIRGMYIGLVERYDQTEKKKDYHPLGIFSKGPERLSSSKYDINQLPSGVYFNASPVGALDGFIDGTSKNFSAFWWDWFVRDYFGLYFNSFWIDKSGKLYILSGENPYTLASWNECIQLKKAK